MTSQRPCFVTIALTSAALWGVLATAPANAQESHCKGLAQAQCGTTAGCGWIDGYTRKDGKTVDGYCKKATLPPGVNRGKGAAEKPVDTAPEKTTGGTRKRTPDPEPETVTAPVAPSAPKPVTGTGTGALRAPAQPQ